MKDNRSCQITATGSKDVTVDTGDNVGLGRDVLAALLRLPNGGLLCRAALVRSDCGPRGGSRKAVQGQRHPGLWRGLGVDWLDGPGLEGVHVRP